MPFTTRVTKMEPDDPMGRAIATIIGIAMTNGVKDAGERLSLLVPNMELENMGTGERFETGEWEITLKKLED